MVHWTDQLPLKLANVISYLLFLGANGYGALGPNHAKWASGAQETFVTPQSWFFSIWGLVHFLLLGFILFQFTPSGYHPTIEGVGWRFPALALLNAIYASLSTMSHDHSSGGRIWAILAFIVMLLIAGTVSTVFHQIKTSSHSHSSGDSSSHGMLDTIVVHLPFSLWHGLSVVLAVIAGFAAFGVDASHNKPGIPSDIFVFVALLFLEATAAGYALYGQGDIASGTVVSLALLAIFQHQTPGHADRFIHWSALVLFLLSLLAVLRSMYALINGRTSRGEGERAPLLG